MKFKPLTAEEYELCPQWLNGTIYTLLFLIYLILSMALVIFEIYFSEKLPFEVKAFYAAYVETTMILFFLISISLKKEVFKKKSLPLFLAFSTAFLIPMLILMVALSRMFIDKLSSSWEMFFNINLLLMSLIGAYIAEKRFPIFLASCFVGHFTYETLYLMFSTLPL